MQISTRIVVPFLLILGTTLLHAGVPSAELVNHVPRERIQAISQQIDSLVSAKLSAHEQKPNRLTDDETFLRRIYLDIVGRIPTLEEAHSFLASKDKSKRAALIDELLDSSGYVSHQFNYWADILRIKSRLSGGNPGQPYIDFVKNSLATNQPYNDFVREMIASEGPVLESGNGATGYYLRDQGMPEDNMANTVRIFLGTRLECAQCHDHPFDTWTQREFFEMVAFTGGVRTRLAPNGMAASMDMRRKLKKVEADPKVKQLAINLMRPLSFGVSGGGTGLARLPDSYQYDDGEPNEIVTAKTMFEHEELVHPEIPATRKRRRRPRNKRFASAIPGARDIGSREVFADWLTSPDNPRFTQVIANRLWKKAMGLGLIEPVDDLTDETVASNPELLRYLTEQMIELDYDMKQYLRAIYYSKTYQREASDSDVTDPSEYFFPGPLLRRMSAEQLWDSFLTLAVPALDDREHPRSKMVRGVLGSNLYEGFEKVKDMSVDEILELAEKELEIRSNPEKRKQRYRDAMMSANEPNGKYIEEAAQLRRRIAALRQMQKRVRQRKNAFASRQLQARISELQSMLRHVPTRIGNDLVRASELLSPAPPGHFLREFGQSDREQIENANSEPAASQVLSLMNGQIEKRIISNPRTVLMRNVVMAESAVEKIDVIFLSMLSRYPSREESTTWQKIAREEGKAAANDLIWSLANTSEFMFVR